MRPSMKTRLEKIEAACGAEHFVVAIAQPGETPEQAVARATEGMTIDEDTLIVCVRRISDEAAHG